MSRAGETRQHSNPVIHPTHSGMVRVPGGSFMMGSDRHQAKEEPAHGVCYRSPARMAQPIDSATCCHLGFPRVVRRDA
jgi:formylglycine-generating enzyme required for sulfatase activity